MRLSYIERGTTQDPASPVLIIHYSQKDSIKNETDSASNSDSADDAQINSNLKKKVVAKLERSRQKYEDIITQLQKY